jgi:hypothetical protein
MSRFPYLRRALAAAALLLATSAPAFAKRIRLIPQFRVGQTLFYRIDFGSARNLKTESAVASSQAPPAANIAGSALLQVEVAQVTPTGFRLKSFYSEPNLPGKSISDSSSQNASPAPDKIVEFTLSNTGQASQIKGFDQLSAAEQFAWNDWLGRFSASMALPQIGISPGEKWHTTEPEASPSPIAELSWLKNFEYVHDEICDASETAPNPKTKSIPSNAERCAVILIRSTLRQKSSPKNATPEDYKLRNLKTLGTAAGQNETILYISLSTGILHRSTENARQSMDAIVALSNGSNQVHYNLDAKSQSQILLLTDSRLNAH